MLNDPLTPKILAALANQPNWVVATPSAAPPSTEPPATAAPPDAAHVAPRCPRCGGTHRLEQCPQVKSIEYYEDGSVRRVEFHESLRPSEPSAPLVARQLVVGSRGEGESLPEVRRTRPRAVLPAVGDRADEVGRLRPAPRAWDGLGLVAVLDEHEQHRQLVVV